MVSDHSNKLTLNAVVQQLFLWIWVNFLTSSALEVLDYNQWLRRLDAVREILTSKGRTLAQVALAWLWGRSPQTLPIPGFKNVKQATENAGALAFGPLTPDQMREIDRILGRASA